MKFLKIKLSYCLIFIMGLLSMNTSHAITATKETPHWNADLYKKHAVRLQQTSALELLETISLKPQARVLDLGCGDGKITITIAEKVPEGFVEAVDLSQEMLALAQQEYGFVKNINFRKMNAEHLDFAQPFDWIFSFFCLQWVKDKPQAFKEISNNLKKDGKAALIMTNRNSYLLEIRSRMIRDKKWKSYFESYEDPTNVIDDDKYPLYAQNAGLQVESYTEKDKTIFFDSKEELKNFIKMVSPVVKMLPTEKIESFLNELTEDYIKAIPVQESSKFYITYNLKTLIIKK